MSASPLDRAVAQVRHFNRFHTRLVGALDKGHLQSAYNLPEARVLYELAHRDHPSAVDLIRELRLDPGYLSRLLRSLIRRDLVTATAHEGDGRRRVLRLTTHGRREQAVLEARADRDMAALLAPLHAGDRDRLLGAVRTVESLLGGMPAAGTVKFRAPRVGDLGWVVQRHGELYAREYRWDERFEALVADVVVQYVKEFDPARDRCWIAEREGERIGSIFLVHQDRRVAKLRLLLVEPGARGLGVGRQLVDECIAFARKAGYREITLWTNDVLHAARRIYQRTGFSLIKREAHTLFGKGLVGETWVLDLIRPTPGATSVPTPAAPGAAAAGRRVDRGSTGRRVLRGRRGRTR
ncbi:MAG: bifunctional helix-turn-helix transcriptional regulator/GNAT family N-acetyltransferase [Gemmatimonadales bacterium]